MDLYCHIGLHQILTLPSKSLRHVDIYWLKPNKKHNKVMKGHTKWAFGADILKNELDILIRIHLSSSVFLGALNGTG